MRERERRIQRALHKSAVRAKKVLAQYMPVAFQELMDSLEVRAIPNGASVGAYAPHAEAVEKGSRPHYPPIEPLIKWVKLRGMQGLLSPARLSKLKGTTTSAHALSVAAQLRAMEHVPIHAERGTDTALSVDAPKRIAYAIQQAIGKNGTKPHHFALKSLPEIMDIIDQEVVRALPDP